MEYIVNVANEMSITKAAEKLFISPSGISQSITQLENELGIKIFNRSKQGVTPTFEGKIVIAKAITLLNTLKELNKEIQEYKNNNLSYLKILTAPTFSFLLQETMVKFNSEHSDVKLELVEENPSFIIQNFNKENYDFALIPATLGELKKEKNIQYEHIHKGHVCIAVGKNSPFYFHDYVTPKDLENTKLVIYKNSDYKRIQRITKLYFNQIITTSNRSSLLFQLVKESEAILFLHEFSIKNRSIVLSEEIKVIPLKEGEKYFEVDFWLVYFGSKGLSEVAKRFIEEFLVHFKRSI
ncbi:LysR family transcriptional regulator [Bacillus sp. EAC]|uniref:LysR family transcriptional regulator n=1 Tax=Bacillus sp. EAC TaxID=1978338 RepID=UPI001C4E7472|nr:LysR family transcriptional regulator [Bacillus sp. EAC]